MMEENSYASNGVKHCVRPQDMQGKSCAVILRQMHPGVLKDAAKYEEHVDLPMWLSTLSLKENATYFHDQKRREAHDILGIGCKGAPKGKQAVKSGKDSIIKSGGMSQTATKPVFKTELS